MFCSQFDITQALAKLHSEEYIHKIIASWSMTEQLFVANAYEKVWLCPTVSNHLTLGMYVTNRVGEIWRWSVGAFLIGPRAV